MSSSPPSIVVQSNNSAASQSSNNTNKNDTSDHDNDSKLQATDDMIELRFIVDNSSVGGLIGKGGANVKEVREACQTFVSILKSDYRHVTERIMVLKGLPENIAKASKMLCGLLIEAATNRDKRQLGPQGTSAETASLKLLVHKAMVGAIIGKAGATIRETQTETGARVQVANDPLPNSTDKPVIVSGNPQSIHDAILKIGQQLKQNPLRAGTKTFNYVPGQNNYNSDRYGSDRPHRNENREHRNDRERGGDRNENYRDNSNRNQQSRENTQNNDQPTSTQKIAIPTVCAGCVIGKGGAVIRDLRNQSGTQISIAEVDSATPNERVVTLTGTPAGIQTAVYLIRQLVEQYQPAPANNNNNNNGNNTNY